MATINVQLERDLEVRVQKFAKGVGVELSDLVERALVYALSSLYPDNTLPGQQPRPDQGLPGQQPGIDNSLPGQPGRPDNALPGEQPGIDNSLPRPPFNPVIDNELPEGEIPVDPGYGKPEGGPDYPSQGQGLNPDLDPNLDPNLDRRKQPKG